MDNLVHFLGADYKPITQPVDTYSSLSYEKKWDEYGNFKFVAAPSLFLSIKDAKRVMVNGNTFLLDNIITKDATANNELSVSGRSLEAILDKVVNPTPLRIRGNLEVQIRAVVTALAITGEQAQSKLALGTLHGYLNSIDTVVPRGSLGRWLYTTLNQRGFTYTLTYDQATDTVVFDIVQEVDRSTTAVFSAQVGNIENVEYSKSDTDACNFAVVYDDETGEVVYVDESNGEEKRALLVQGKSANTASDDSLYVALDGGTGDSYTATDGKAFTKASSFTAPYSPQDLIYSAGMFWTCGYDTGGAYALKGSIKSSTNAVTWTDIVANNNYRLLDLAYNDGLLVATGSILASDTWAIVTSYNGYDTITTEIGKDKVFGRASYVQGKWIVCAYNRDEDKIVFYTSTYGRTWDRHAFTPPAHDTHATDDRVTLYSVVDYKGELIAIGWIDPVGGADNSDILIAKSDDLFETCTFSTQNVSNLSKPTYAVYENGVIAVCGGLGLGYSLDGISFTGVASAYSYDFKSGILWDGYLFHSYAAVTAVHAFSADAQSWTIESMSPLGYFRRTAYGTSTQVMSMRDIGRVALAESRSVEVIDGDVLPNIAPIIGTDCNVGDIAGVVDIKRGIIAAKRLVSAKTVIEKQAHYTVPKFGTDYLSLTKYIAKEIAKNV